MKLPDRWVCQILCPPSSTLGGTCSSCEQAQHLRHARDNHHASGLCRPARTGPWAAAAFNECMLCRTRTTQTCLHGCTVLQVHGELRNSGAMKHKSNDVIDGRASEQLATHHNLHHSKLAVRCPGHA